jgi:capsular polysaccharide transport system permease protein
MNKLTAGWRIQRRVIGALMIRELITRFGRENIGFLWIMVEPLLFAVLVGIGWRYLKGPEEHGVSVFAFIATGYIPLTFFRHCVSRSVRIFSVNGSLLYHRQVLIFDLIFTRILIEFIGSMMAYLFIGLVLYLLNEFPIPSDMVTFFAGWTLYCLFVLSLCLILAPLSEMSDVLEKFIPVTTYVMIPFSGCFNMVSWLAPGAQNVMHFSPFVQTMEMMRQGVFGSGVDAVWDASVPILVTLILMPIGIAMCRTIRRRLVVE